MKALIFTLGAALGFAVARKADSRWARFRGTGLRVHEAEQVPTIDTAALTLALRRKEARS